MVLTIKKKQAWPVREASSEPFKCEYTRQDFCTSGIALLKEYIAPDSTVHVLVIRELKYLHKPEIVIPH
jgi:hypothetical protein